MMGNHLNPIHQSFIQNWYGGLTRVIDKLGELVIVLYEEVGEPIEDKDTDRQRERQDPVLHISYGPSSS
jgi:hypothetical protein